MPNATPTPATTEDELREEWFGLYARLREIDPQLADQVETNTGLRAAGDIRPLLSALRASRAALVAALEVVEETLEQYDPS